MPTGSCDWTAANTRAPERRRRSNDGAPRSLANLRRARRVAEIAAGTSPDARNKWRWVWRAHRHGYSLPWSLTLLGRCYRPRKKPPCRAASKILAVSLLALDRRTSAAARSGRPTPRTAATGRRLLRLRRSEEHTSELQSRLHLVCRL